MRISSSVIKVAGLVALAAAVVVAATAYAPRAWAEGSPSVVKIAARNGGFRLHRNGETYFIKGVGGSGSLDLLAACGGNSVRTWGADNLGPLLDDAQKRGITVTVGIWLGHKEHGFDYDNADQVAKQYEDARQAILKYKDHPALLMWGIGNEMEISAGADNAAVWSAVNNIAAMAHKLDPNHPTMTVIAEIGGNKVKAAPTAVPPAPTAAATEAK